MRLNQDGQTIRREGEEGGECSALVVLAAEGSEGRRGLIEDLGKQRRSSSQQRRGTTLQDFRRTGASRLAGRQRAPG